MTTQPSQVLLAAVLFATWRPFDGRLPFSNLFEPRSRRWGLPGFDYKTGEAMERRGWIAQAGRWWLVTNDGDAVGKDLRARHSRDRLLEVHVDRVRPRVTRAFRLAHQQCVDLEDFDGPARASEAIRIAGCWYACAMYLSAANPHPLTVEAPRWIQPLNPWPASPSLRLSSSP